MLLPSKLRRIFSQSGCYLGHTAWRAVVLVSFKVLIRKAQMLVSDAILKRGDFMFYDLALGDCD